MGQGRLETALRHVPLHSGTASLKGRIGIRRATQLDLPRILRIEARCFHEDAWPRELFSHYLDHAASIFLIAATPHRALGYALAAPRKSTWELDSIAVLPNAQGRGIATRLLRRLIVLVTKQNGRGISLMVRCENSAAIHLYRKLGFERTRRINDYYEDGSPAWRMHLKVSD